MLGVTLLEGQVVLDAQSLKVQGFYNDLGPRLDGKPVEQSIVRKNFIRSIERDPDNRADEKWMVRAGAGC